MARMIRPEREMTESELLLNLENRIMAIRNRKCQTSAMRDLANRALEHLRRKEWDDLAAFLKFDLRDYLFRLQGLSGAANSKKRDMLNRNIALDRQLLKQIHLKKYKPIIECLKNFLDNSTRSRTKEAIQPAIVSLKEGDSKPALAWLRRERLRYRQKSRRGTQSQMTVNRLWADLLDKLVKHLEK